MRVEFVSRDHPCEKTGQHCLNFAVDGPACHFVDQLTNGENELQQAIDTFNQVIKTYPNTIEATNGRLSISEIRAFEPHPLTQAKSNQEIR
ncbi:MAG: hypothetical protein DMG13_16300 [Acidobacteria bacterium]|nr:MAG: hypothetical protein DMG13_16300 [Acidobacteriota bacterium]